MTDIFNLCQISITTILNFFLKIKPRSVLNLGFYHLTKKFYKHINDLLSHIQMFL